MRAAVLPWHAAFGDSMIRVGVRVASCLGLLLRSISSDADCLGAVQHLTYPDDCGILQECIDAAPCNGGVVEIADDLPILDPIHFEKGLTLRAAPGHKPLLLGALTATPGIENSLDGYEIRIEGLTFGAGAGIEVEHNSPNPLAVEVVGNTLGPAASAISINAFSYTGAGPIEFDVSDNAITVSSSDNPFGIGIWAETEANGRIANNRIAIAPGQPLAAGLFSYEFASSGVDVVANRVSGMGYGWGIYVDSSGIGTARIADNLVTGQVGSDPSYGFAALTVNSEGALAATVVDNTVAGNDRGIVISTFTDSPSDKPTVSGLLANNVASGNAVSGITVPGEASSLLNRNNLVFGNGTDDFTPGPGTITEDPHFVGNGDYHLQLDSPAIDAGDDSAVPGDLATDLDGSPRIQGSRVDLGAYETAPEAGAPLAGAAALLALRALGRWTRGRTQPRRRSR